ncbi:GNAT family N-acetyltransferase [Longispora sp. NPDC051575]|uniref:GNAT family N-acetyltransferase n=1 Tax=Longispora sp. NPDC051575 TaxID=3154943 RepID=UPI003437FFD7
MLLTTVHDREDLGTRFSADAALHAYELGDLDDFFWPYTTWYRLRGGQCTALVYTGAEFGPILLALSRPDRDEELRSLVTHLLPVLPRRFYAHVTGGAHHILAKEYEVTDHGVHRKMALVDFTPVTGEPTVVLTPADLGELRELYDRAYPGNTFDARMLDGGDYVGIRRDGRLVAVAGLHVHSPSRRIAALGNVTTLPELRGQGLAAVAVSALCTRLLETVDHIGLNVKADNVSAIGLYERLGFVAASDYQEISATAR